MKIKSRISLRYIKISAKNRCYTFTMYFPEKTEQYMCCALQEI